MLVAAIVILGVSGYSIVNGILLPGIVCLGGFSKKYGFLCLGFASVALWFNGHFVAGSLPILLIVWNIVGNRLFAPRPKPHYVSQNETHSKGHVMSSANSMPASQLLPAKKLSAEIHFHKQDEASVYFESSCTGEEEVYGEVLLFSCFCLTTLEGLRDQSIVDNLVELLYSIGSREECLKLIDYVGKDGVNLVQYQGLPGRKRIDVKLDIESNPIKFNTIPTGFDPYLAVGVDYYFSHSIIILFKYLLNRRRDDMAAFNSLMYAASMCGMRYVQDPESVSSNPIKEAMDIAEIALDS